MEARERTHLIALYRGGARAVGEAVASLSVTDLDRHAGGGWSARSVVHHVADADLIEGVRLRRILAEDGPLLPWTDEEEHARRLDYERPIETSLSLGVFQAVVMSNASLLTRPSPASSRMT